MTRRAKCLICKRGSANLDGFGRCGRCRGEVPARKEATPDRPVPAPPVLGRGEGPVEPDVRRLIDRAKTTCAAVREAHPDRSLKD